MRVFRIMLITSLISVALLESGLRLLDPSGVLAVQSDLRTHYALLTDDEPYRYRDGVHEWSAWDTTIENGYRVTPGDGDCTIAALGDSFMFGWGADDTGTLPAHMAQRFDVRVVNRALPAYTLDDVLWHHANTDADGYVYLAYVDDRNTTRPDVRPRPFASRSALVTHWRVMQPPPTVAQMTEAAFWEQVRALDDTVVGVIGMAPQGDAVFIPFRFELTVSASDRHYTAAGYAYVADVLDSAVGELVSEVCDRG